MSQRHQLGIIIGGGSNLQRTAATTTAVLIEPLCRAKRGCFIEFNKKLYSAVFVI